MEHQYGEPGYGTVVGEGLGPRWWIRWVSGFETDSDPPPPPHDSVRPGVADIDTDMVTLALVTCRDAVPQ